MKKVLSILLVVASGCAIVEAQQCVPTETYESEVLFSACNEVLLPGEFSVGATQKVRFACGNMQWMGPWVDAAHPGTWRFAPNQWDYIGEAAGNTTDGDANRKVQTNWIDLFGYGTTGQVYYYNTGEDNGPWITRPNVQEKKGSYFWYDDYYAYDLDGTNGESPYDYNWGVKHQAQFNRDACNSFNGRWTVLSKAEWTYLLSDRANAADKYAFCTVNGVAGMVLLPDQWTNPATCPAWVAGMKAGTAYTVAEWMDMETAGAVFLPAAGRREVSDNSGYINIIAAGKDGYYWTSSSKEDMPRKLNWSYGLQFSCSNKPYLYTMATDRAQGCSVRLVYFVP